MKAWIRDNALTLFFTALFAGTLVAQAFVGHADHNHEQIAHGGAPLTLGRYVSSSVFWVDVMENWQSEYLQFSLFILATVWLVQRGSTESKQPGEEGRESDEEQKADAHAESDSPLWARIGGWRTTLYGNSLVILMTVIWLGAWLAQAVTGRVEYNSQQLEATVSLVTYVGTSDFWSRTLQNWQSEFLAVGSIAIFSVYLRQRGSSQSKPLGASHEATAEEG